VALIHSMTRMLEALKLEFLVDKRREKDITLVTLVRASKVPSLIN
jgi:hypothetical protein